jgi:hypothetical protein
MVEFDVIYVLLYMRGPQVLLRHAGAEMVARMMCHCVDFTRPQIPEEAVDEYPKNGRVKPIAEYLVRMSTDPVDLAWQAPTHTMTGSRYTRLHWTASYDVEARNPGERKPCR